MDGKVKQEMKRKKEIIPMLILLCGALSMSFHILRRKDKTIRELLHVCQKDERMIQLYSFWMLHQGSYGEYLRSMGIRKVIVYGIGYLGKSLIEELNHSCVEILYAADQCVDEELPGIEICEPDSIREGADLIIVTAIDSFLKIKERIEKQVETTIVSIEDVIYYMMDI